MRIASVSTGLKVVADFVIEKFLDFRGRIQVAEDLPLAGIKRVEHFERLAQSGNIWSSPPEKSVQIQNAFATVCIFLTNILVHFCCAWRLRSYRSLVGSQARHPP